MTIRQPMDWASPDGQGLAASVSHQMQRPVLRGPLTAVTLMNDESRRPGSPGAGLLKFSLTPKELL
jgi:hypothetical protein